MQRNASKTTKESVEKRTSHDSFSQGGSGSTTSHYLVGIEESLQLLEDSSNQPTSQGAYLRNLKKHPSYSGVVVLAVVSCQQLVVVDGRN